MHSRPSSAVPAGGKRALILGGAGFLGSHLARRLLELDYDVTIFDRPQVSDQRIRTLPGARRIEGDVFNEVELRPALEEHRLVFHFVGSTVPASSNENPTYDVKTNVVGTLRILDLAHEVGVEKIVFPSSGGAVYGPCPEIPRREEDPAEPISSYGLSKLTVERYLEIYRRLYGLEYLCFRFSNPYGGDQTSFGVLGAVSTFLQCARSRRTARVFGDGSVTRDYIHVDDAIEAVVRGLSYRGPHRLFNVGTGVGTSLNELLRKVQGVTGVELDRSHDEHRSADVPWNVLDTTRAREGLGWRAETPLEEGIRRLWEEGSR